MNLIIVGGSCFRGRPCTLTLSARYELPESMISLEDIYGDGKGAGQKVGRPSYFE